MPTTIIRYVKSGLPVVLALLCLPSPERARAQENDAEWLENCRSRDVHRERHCEVRELTLGPTDRLRVDGGENGGVAVRAHEGRGIQVRARLQARARSGGRAEALAREIRIVTAAGELRAEGPRTAGGESWSVVFYLDVPREIDLELRAKNGPVSVRGVSGRLELVTENGPVAVQDVGGDVRARTENGPLHVRLAGSHWEGSGLDAETENGPVNLEVPENYSAELEMGTVNGPMVADFPVTVTLRGRLSQRMTLTLGDGGTRVRVMTTNGPFNLRRPNR